MSAMLLKLYWFNEWQIRLSQAKAASQERDYYCRAAALAQANYVIYQVIEKGVCL